MMLLERCKIHTCPSKISNAKLVYIPVINKWFVLVFTDYISNTATNSNNIHILSVVEKYFNSGNFKSDE